MNQARRKFLKTSVCGLTGAALVASLDRLNLVNAMVQQNQPDVAADYKALVCIFLNVGPLVRPITRANYAAGIGRPYQLFSHSDQVAQQQTSISNTVGQTGWGGRVADKTNPLNGPSGLPMTISVAGTSLFATGVNSR